MGGDDSRDWSDPEQQAAPKPRGRPRKSVPQQAAATSEEPAKGVLGKGPAGQRRPDQDSKQTSEQDYSAYKRSKSAAADDEVASAGQDADTVQEHLPAKRRRTPLFSIQDIIAAEKGHGADGVVTDQMNHFQQQQQQQQAGLPPAGISSRPDSRQHQHPAYEQDWAALLHQQQYQLHQQQPGGYQTSPMAAAAAAAAATTAANVDEPGPSNPAGHAPSPAAAAAAGQPLYQQQLSTNAASLHPAVPAPGSSRSIYGSGFSTLDPAAAAATPSMEPVQQQQQQQQQYAPPQQQQQQQQQQQRVPSPTEFNPDLLAKGAQRDMALQRERRVLAESAQCELGPDSLGPDTNVATLVQKILKCGVLTRKTVEYRKRAKGLVPSDYNRGTITSAGLIRCGCHGQDITMSEFEQHSNSQIHRPAEYIFIKSIDMSLKSFANLVLQKPIESNLWYCLSCNEGGDLLCCEGCPAAFHTTCLGQQNQPVANQEWMCADCLTAGKKPRWSADGPLRRQVPLAGAAAATAGGAGTSTSMRRSSSSAGGGRSAARVSSGDGGGGGLGRKGSGPHGGSSSLYGAGTAAAAAAPGAGHGHQKGANNSGAAMTNSYYEQEEPYTSAAAAAGMPNPYVGMTNPQSGVAGTYNGRTQGSAPAAAAVEPQYPASGFSQPPPGSNGLNHAQGLDTSGFGGYDQGFGLGPGCQASLVSQGLAGYIGPSPGLAGGAVYGDFNATKPLGDGTAVKPETDVLAFNQGVTHQHHHHHHQQQQQQSGIDQLLQNLSGGNMDLLQMLQKHLQPHPAAAGADHLQQQQQQHSDSRPAGGQTPSTASGVEQQQQQLSPLFEQQQQQQRQIAVARKGSSTLDPAAAAAAPVAQLPIRTPSGIQQHHHHQQHHQQQRSDLAALAAAAEAAAAPEPALAAAAEQYEHQYSYQRHLQQQHTPAADSVAAAHAAAAAAQLCATALKASEVGTSGEVMAQVLQLTRHMAQQQQQQFDQPASAGDQSVAAALLQMVAAAVAATSEQQHQQAGTLRSQREPGTAAGPQAAAVPATATAAATREETATTNSGIGNGQAAAAAAVPGPMDQDADSRAAAAVVHSFPATAAAPQQQQQLVSDVDRRAAVAVALQAGSSLVSNVLGASSLSDAQRAVAAAGAQLLQALGGLL